MLAEICKQVRNSTVGKQGACLQQASGHSVIPAYVMVPLRQRESRCASSVDSSDSRWLMRLALPAAHAVDRSLEPAHSESYEANEFDTAIESMLIHLLGLVVPAGRWRHWTLELRLARLHPRHQCYLWFFYVSVPRPNATVLPGGPVVSLLSRAQLTSVLGNEP
jgi:hypothetical protein